MRLFIFLIHLLLIFSTAGFCAENPDVIFLAGLPTPAEYSIFANSGWDGNWYLGKKHGWVKKFGPLLEAGHYDKVFLGACLGRAKSAEGSARSAAVFIGISSELMNRPAGKILTRTEYIPRQGSDENAVENTGQARWFWVEVDGRLISGDSDNFVHLWTDDEKLDSADASPILAAGLAGADSGETYLYESSGSIKKISYFDPGIAVKMVRTSGLEEPEVTIREIKRHTLKEMSFVVTVNCLGVGIYNVGLQMKTGEDWIDVGFPVYSPPYSIVFDSSDFSPGKCHVRAFLNDWYGRKVYSKAEQIILVQR